MTKKFLNDKKIDYENIDVSSNEAGIQEMIKISGQMGVPVLNINGKIIVGFNKPEIEAALKKI
jgi:glutaredoxin